METISKPYLSRTGKAGKGFAVVADEIRNLSMGTQNSSNSIMEALRSLEDISDKMTESITSILNLIADDLKNLGGEIQVVDSAMKSVENSNKNMVDNMKQVQDIMVMIKESVMNSEKTTETMLSKYEETARNVKNIESVVDKLVEELGAGNVMNDKEIL